MRARAWGAPPQLPIHLRDRSSARAATMSTATSALPALPRGAPLSGLLTARRSGDEIELNFPIEAPSPVLVPGHLLEGLGVTAVSVHRNRFDYFVEVADEQSVGDLQPDFTRLRQVATRGISVTSRSDDARFDFVSRFFAPAVGVNEDPVCGSSHCGLGPFWQQRLGKSELLAHQISRRGGVLRVTCDGDRVRLAGRAVLVTQGELLA